MGWPEEQQAAALEAVDALPKALRRVARIDEKARHEAPDERQGQDRIKQLVRKVDSLLQPTPVAKPQRRLGSSREDLLVYLQGTNQPDTWRDLTRTLGGDLRLAVRLRHFCDYQLADALAALQPTSLSERIEWLLGAKRFRGRFRLTAERERALRRLRAALEMLPSNARAGRPDAAHKPLVRAAVIAWKAFGRPVNFTLARPAKSRRSPRSFIPKLSGDIISFTRDLITVAKLPQPTDAALSQMLRTLRSV